MVVRPVALRARCRSLPPQWAASRWFLVVQLANSVPSTSSSGGSTATTNASTASSVSSGSSTADTSTKMY